MEERKDQYKKAYRNITIRTTDGSTLMGKVNLGIKERVSDLFTKTENPFYPPKEQSFHDLRIHSHKNRGRSHLFPTIA